MPDNRVEVYRQFQMGQERRIYFLLAAAAAGIAFAIQQTQNTAITLGAWPLGAAVLSWAVSFYAGCRNRDYVLSGQYSNMEMLTVQLGQHAELDKYKQHPEAIAFAERKIKDTIAQNDLSANFWSKTQFRALVTGALFFIAWHVWGMYERMPPIGA